MTAAFVVTWKGRLIAERYGAGITAHTPLESWSMGKSVTATLMGILIRQGVYELAQPAPIPEWQAPGRSAREDPHRRPPEHVERPADQGAAGSRLRPGGALSRSPVSLHGQRQLVPLRRHASAAVAARAGGPVSQHRSGADQLPHSPGRREARRGVPVVPAARALRQDRHPDDGDRNGSVRELPDAGLRPHVGARLGASRQSLSSGRRLERRADSARGVREVREHAGAGLGSRQAPRSTAASSGSTATARSRSRRRPTTCPARAARRR